MALAIGVPAGGKFYVDDTVVEVLEFENYHRAVLLVNGKKYDVDDLRSVEILPEVFVSCGKPSQDRLRKYQQVVNEYEAKREAGQASEPPGKLLPRLLIDAPRRIQVLREELYRKGKRANDRH